MKLFGQSVHESLNIPWPKEYNWKIISEEIDSLASTLKMIPGNENIETNTIVGNISIVKNNFHVSDIDQVIDQFRKSALQQSSNAKFKVLEKKENTKNFWTIFKAETSSFPNDPNPESQLWFIIQGDSTLYINFVAVRQSKLNKEFIVKWTQVFKNSQLVYE